MTIDTIERAPTHTRQTLPVPYPVAIPPTGLEGLLAVPDTPCGLVVFAHGSGSSRFSLRNTYVAEGLQSVGFATLLFDLLTDKEGGNRNTIFNIALLAERLTMAIAWLDEVEAVRTLPIGLFGASTGAAGSGTPVGAVVSRGGRPDLAAPILADVAVPTLFIVGGRDEAVLDVNRRALAQMHGHNALRIVPGAGHMFAEPGTLDAVIAEAKSWFLEKLTGG